MYYIYIFAYIYVYVYIHVGFLGQPPSLVRLPSIIFLFVRDYSALFLDVFDFMSD
jgi:hypothetical protein